MWTKTMTLRSSSSRMDVERPMAASNVEIRSCLHSERLAAAKSTNERPREGEKSAIFRHCFRKSPCLTL